MSDHENDEFDALKANTLNRSRTVNLAKSNNPVSSNPNYRKEAGPSKSGASNYAPSKRKKAQISEDEEDIIVKDAPTKKGLKQSRLRQEQQYEDEGREASQSVNSDGQEGELHDNEEIMEVDPPHSKTKPRDNKGTVKARVKSREKITGTVRTRGQTKTADDDIETVAEDERASGVYIEDMEDRTMDGQTKLARALSMVAKSGHGLNVERLRKEKERSSILQKKDDEINRLKEQLSQVEKHNKDLTRQLDEVWRVRQTEPEKLMEIMEQNHQAILKAKEELIRDLTTRVTRNSEFLPGKNAAFEVITREEANKENQALQQQVRGFKDNIKDNQKLIKQQEDEIKTLQEDKHMLHIQLNAEIERAKTINVQSRVPGSSSRPRAGGLLSSNQDPKLSQVIAFYEDLTNVIVPQMRVQPGKYLDTDEWLLNCCYTHKDVVNKDNTAPKSLSFNLRLCYDMKPDGDEPVVSKEQLIQSVHYMPLELQYESQEFVKSLGFLSDTFTFERDQLSLFLRTLYDYVSGEKSDEDNNSDDSVQIMDD